MSEDDLDSEEEDMPVVGGEGFTPEELAHAEQAFSVKLVRQLLSHFFALHVTPFKLPMSIDFVEDACRTICMALGLDSQSSFV